MQLNTVIFDIDGLLINSEPLWEEAANEVFTLYGLSLTEEQYKTTTGLKTQEFIHWWFDYFTIGEEEFAKAEKKIIELVLQKVADKGNIMPGVGYIFDFFVTRNFKIGLASSSPQELIDLAIKMTGIKKYVQATSSA